MSLRTLEKKLEAMVGNSFKVTVVPGHNRVTITFEYRDLGEHRFQKHLSFEKAGQVYDVNFVTPESLGLGAVSGFSGSYASKIIQFWTEYLKSEKKL